MTRENVGFSFLLHPQFPTNRTALEIHPDGNVYGTKGCIGLEVGAQDLQRFYFTLSTYIHSNGSIRLIVAVAGNLNNQGPGELNYSAPH
jgi:hypothetical protein